MENKIFALLNDCINKLSVKDILELSDNHPQLMAEYLCFIIQND